MNEQEWGRGPWPHEDLADDFDSAVAGNSWTAGPATKSVGIDGSVLPPLTRADVVEVVRWHVSYHGQGKWRPGDNTGTELSLYAVLKLHGGRWASVVAGNDYAGWGCQDFSDVRVGGSEDEVVRYGLDTEGRELLDYPEEA